jgi:hypothetical protein
MGMQIKRGLLLETDEALTPATGVQPLETWTNLVLSDERVRVPFLEPASWFVLLLPVQPIKETEGSIELADSTQEAQRVFNCVGEVLAVGPAVYRGTTNSGIDMRQLPKQNVGEFWAYPQHSGQRYYLRERYTNGQKAYQLVLKDGELLGRVPDPKRNVVWI